MGNTKATALTKEQIIKMLHEVLLEQEKVEEGFIDRVLAKARGNVSGLKTFGKNLGQVFQAATTGKGEFTDPRMAKAVATATSRIKSYNKQISKNVVEFASDLEAIFGDGLQNAPQQLKQKLTEFGEASKQLLTLTGEIGKEVEGLVSSRSFGGQDQGNEPASVNRGDVSASDLPNEPQGSPQDLGPSASSRGDDEEDPLDRMRRNAQLRNLASVQEIKGKK